MTILLITHIYPYSCYVLLPQDTSHLLPTSEKEVSHSSDWRSKGSDSDRPIQLRPHSPANNCDVSLATMNDVEEQVYAPALAWGSPRLESQPELSLSVSMLVVVFLEANTAIALQCHPPRSTIPYSSMISKYYSVWDSVFQHIKSALK
jgi:hypothetical protein